MTRSIAGIFAPGRRVDRARLTDALLPSASHLLAHGPLSVSHTGAPTASGGPLCLLAGCLDNAAALLAELDCRRDASVEAVLTAAYVRWGAQMLSSLRGDFALLIWDRGREEGLIARDQLGVRSLYLHDEGGVLRFATEVRELLALLPRRPGPDAAGVAHWLAASARADGGGTLYEGVRRVAPGGVLLLARAGVREERYWTPSFVEPALEAEPATTGGESALAVQVREAIGCSVRRRVAGGPAAAAGAAPAPAVGVLMSGGLDSASVAAMAAREAPGRVTALSGVFPGHPAADESELIGELRSSLALHGVTAEVRPGGLLASALEAQRAWQLPLLSWGDFWTQPLLRAAAARGTTVVLGGDGGDELFATRVYLLADRLRAGRPVEALRLARELPGAGEHPSRREVLRITTQLAFGGAVPRGPHEAVRRRLAVREAPAWLTRSAARQLLAAEDPLAWKRLAGPRWWAHAAHGLTRGIEQVGIFEMHRHRAALAGLEARHPLLDLDLVETVLRQSPMSTFDRHRNRPMLRAGMAGMLPDTVRLRPRKALFDPLIVDTLSGGDDAAVRVLLCDPRAEVGAYVELASVRRSLLDDDALRLRRPFEWMQQVWRLSTAECWLRAQSDPERDGLRDLLRPSPARLRLRDVARGAREGTAQAIRDAPVFAGAATGD